MATLTIKFESEDLAREVLAHLGYLPDASVEDESPLPHPRRVKESPPEKRLPGPSTMYCKEDLSQATLKMPEVQKQNEFCTTENPEEGVEPVENEMGASLTHVFTEEMDQERDALGKQAKEISDYIFYQTAFDHKDENRRRAAKKLFVYHDITPAEAAEKHLKKLISALSDDSERVNFLTHVKMDHADEDMRAAAKAHLSSM